MRDVFGKPEQMQHSQKTKLDCSDLHTEGLSFLERGGGAMVNKDALKLIKAHLCKWAASLVPSSLLLRTHDFSSRRSSFQRLSVDPMAIRKTDSIRPFTSAR